MCSLQVKCQMNNMMSHREDLSVALTSEIVLCVPFVALSQQQASEVMWRWSLTLFLGKRPGDV